MFKRSLLAVTFIGALALLSLGATPITAHGCDYGYGGYGGYYPNYTTAYYGAGFGPRLAYYPRVYPVYPTYYRGYDGGHHHHRHHDHDGIRISFGF